MRFEGRDASAFLQALLTNDILALAGGLGTYAALLTPQGRMIADLRVHHMGEHLLAEVPTALAAGLRDRFDQLIFSEDVRVIDVSDSLAQVVVVGQTAASLLAHAFALEPIEPGSIAMLPLLGHLAIGTAIVARSDDLDLPAYDVFVDAAAREAAVARLEEMGAERASPELLDALRIEAGHPAFGVDMTEETIPLEAGLLERAISTTKGCYVGQEIIIRVLHRGGGRVAKRLVKLRFDPRLTAPSAPGAALSRHGRDVGSLTSAAISPRTGHVVALGYVHRDHAETGVTLTVGAHGPEAEIVGLAG